MIEYDATKSRMSPPYEIPPPSRIIRSVYDQDGFVSQLIGALAEDGVELFLNGRPGMTKVTAFDTRHHHISILTANPQPYAELFGTKKFIMTHDVLRRDAWSRKRFPEWTVTPIEIGYRMELTVE